MAFNFSEGNRQTIVQQNNYDLKSFDSACVRCNDRIQSNDGLEANTHASWNVFLTVPIDKNIEAY